MTRTLALALAAMVGASPALAQAPNPTATKELPYDRGYDKHTPKHDAVDAAEKPETERLNQIVGANTTERRAVNEARARDQARYDADMAAYMAAVQGVDARNRRDRAFYNRQQAAYADAMEAWRWQVDDCNRGVLKACSLPTPNPADFF